MKTRAGVNMSTRDYEGFRTDMIEMLKKKIPEYSDFSSSDMGIVMIELMAHGLDVLSYYNDKVANELFLETATERESVARLTRMLGYTLQESNPAKYMQVFEIIPQETEFIIPKGFVVKTEATLTESFVEFETDEDLIIPPHCTGLEKDEEGNYLYAVSITEGYTVYNEVVGTSNGSPNQKFHLQQVPVIYDSIQVVVEDLFETVDWTKVDNFLESESTSKHYIAQMSDDGLASIQFGNGVSGLIPNIYNDGIRCTYRVGGGKQGNVGPNTITRMTQRLSGIVQTFNPSEPYIWGKDSENIEEARIKAPAQIGAKYGIVTLADFKNFAIGTKGVQRATAMLMDLPKPTVALYYHPDGTVPKKELEQYLIDEYNERKLVGTSLRLEQGGVCPIDITVYIKLMTNASSVVVDNLVRTYIKDNIYAGAYDFGECPEPSDLIIDITNLDGVRASDVDISGVENLTSKDVITLGTLTVQFLNNNPTPERVIRYANR